MFNSSSWLFKKPPFYKNVATQSVRYNDNDSPYLQRTHSGGNQQSWTWSGWVKRGNLGQQNLFGTDQDGSNIGRIEFRSDHKIKVNNKTGNTNGDECKTLAVFRDVSAWYHIVVSFDGSQSTQADRTKIYVNGVLQDKVTDLALSAGNGLINSNRQHAVGARGVSLSTHFDGYMAEVNFVDGQTLDETDFGEFKNGVWIPKKYTGTYGTNGFRLEFKNSSVGSGSSSTIGADTSGNDNHLTSSGIVASDCAMPDSPELNFCTLSTLHLPSNTNNQLIKGALVADATSTSWSQAPASWAFQAGEKWYWEVSADNTAYYVGVASPNVVRQSANALIGWDNPLREAWVYNSGGQIRYNGANQTTTTAISANDILAFAVDVDGGTLRFYINNVLKYTASHDFTGWFPDAATINSVYLRHNFGQDGTFAGLHTAQGNTDENGYGDFYYTPPSGYLAMCSANLNIAEAVDPTEGNSPTDYFNTVLYTGNGSGGHAITGVGFQPNWTWIKGRNYAGYHYLVDSVRGYTERLFSNLADGASVEANTVTSADSDGFTLGSDPGVNNNTSTYVAWNWKTSGGTIATNTAGTITSSVSANADAGFSIVNYTGNGSAGATVGHGLGVIPKVVLYKSRSASGFWHVYHEEIGAGNAIYLNAGNSSAADPNFLNNTAPSSTLLTLGSSSGANGSSTTYVAYCFAEIDGYSKFGGYTGNSSSDGVFIYTGFRPAWFMVKVASGFTNNWTVYDNKTTTFNPDNTYLLANGSGTEVTANEIDFLSNGIKLRNSSQAENNSSGTYIYMAFAEAPFKYSNAR